MTPEQEAQVYELIAAYKELGGELTNEKHQEIIDPVVNA